MTQSDSEKRSMYLTLVRQIEALGEGISLPLPNLANAAALLWQTLPDINWAGFYLLKGNDLYLGPFQGKTACTYIAYGRGVCGTAVAARQTQLVPDVHAFPGHIACDSASASELVIPLTDGQGKLYGVLDIDSPVKARFDAADAEGLTQFCKALMESIHWEAGLL